MMPLEQLAMLSLAVSSTSMTISKANIFGWLRDFVADEFGDWAGDLINCPYCLSHWLAFLGTKLLFTGSVLDFILNSMAVVTLASLSSWGITKFFLALDDLDERSEECD